MRIFSKLRKIKYTVGRKIIQIIAFGFCNMHAENLGRGTIYTGKWKEFCVPGLNCYSCPAAAFSCPIGAMQAVGGMRSMSFGFYAAGIVLAFGVVLGRAVCGYLCPFGLIQDLIGLIPVKKRKIPKLFKYIKYAVLAVLVLLLPAVITDAAGLGQPWFCEYICPAGTLSGLLLFIGNSSLAQTAGILFAVKLGILIAVIVFCIFIYRFFCKVLCPLGAIYALLNKISIYHVQCDSKKCTVCGKCASTCRMDVDPSKEIRSTECILCGKCTEVCPHDALKMKWKR